MRFLRSGSTTLTTAQGLLLLAQGQEVSVCVASSFQTTVAGRAVLAPDGVYEVVVVMGHHQIAPSAEEAVTILLGC